MTSTAAMIQQGKGAGAGGSNAVPFLLGSALYTETPFGSFTSQLTTAQQDVTPVWQVTPGNFLDGITLTISSTGGVLPTSGSLTQNGGLGVINYISFVNTGGGEILYPMPLFEYVMAQKYLRPWAGDPQQAAAYSNSINPAVTVDLSVGVKDTLAILSNTDARAQYRLRVTLAPVTSVATGASTAPTVTVTAAIKSWAQPPATDYAGRPIEPYPPGLGVSRKLQTQTLNMPASGTATLQLTLTGDEIRGLILICRSSAGTRTDLTDANAGPIQFRLDNGIVWTMLPSQIVWRMEEFYAQYFGAGGLNREAGVYAIPRFRSPNGGDPWLPTVEQSYLNLQLGSADIAGGTIEVLYDQLAVGVVLPPSLESV
jgi:hypothetical protein